MTANHAELITPYVPRHSVKMSLNQNLSYFLGTSFVWIRTKLLIEDNATEGCEIGSKEPYSEPIPWLSNITKLMDSPFEVVPYPTWNIGLKVTFYIVAITMALVGNLLVIVTIASNKQLHSSTNLYVVNLAVSDLMVAFFCMWVHLGINITVDWPFNEFICKVYPFFQIVAVSASVLFLAAISGERFFAIIYPLKRKFSKTHVHIMVVIFIWSVALLIAVPNLLVRNLQRLEWKDRDQVWCEERWPRIIIGEDEDSSSNNTLSPYLTYCIYDHPLRRIYYTIQFSIMYLVPVVVMTLAFSVITCKLRTYNMPGNMTDSILEYQEKTKRRVIRRLIFVLLAFVICWTPHLILLVYNAHSPEEVAEIPSWIPYLALYAAYFNSALNPFLYAGLNKNIRKGMKHTIGCGCCKKNKIEPLGAESHPSNPRDNQEHATTVGSNRHTKRKHSSLLHTPALLSPSTKSKRKRSVVLLPTITEDEAERISPAPVEKSTSEKSIQ